MLTELTLERRHAVVIGASIAGLATARVLAERYARVTVLERHANPRASVDAPVSIAPQGRYPHVLLDGGGLAAERLFPSFKDEAIAAGAPLVDRDTVRWWSDGWRVKRRRDSRTRVLASRGLIETIIRTCVDAIPNVRIDYGVTPEGLAMDGDRVVGVRLGGMYRASRTPPCNAATSRDNPHAITTKDGAGSVLDADLVVDCSGRGSRLVPWLEAAGYPAPPTTEIDVDLTYLVLTLRRRPSDLDGATAMIIQNIAPEMTRLGLAIAIEGDRWMVMLGGYFGDMAPMDREGYLAFAASLPVPELASLLRGAMPISEPLPYRFGSSRRVHVERAPRWPIGLVALGDATCSFNPLYGQGMSVALMQAERLGKALDDCASAKQLSKSIQRELARITDLAWTIAAGGDLAYPQVVGERKAISNLIRRYMGKVFRACSVDADVVDALFEVTNLVASPARLLRPAMIVRVLRAQRQWTATATGHSTRTGTTHSQRVSVGDRLPTAPS